MPELYILSLKLGNVNNYQQNMQQIKFSHVSRWVWNCISYSYLAETSYS